MREVMGGSQGVLHPGDVFCCRATWGGYHVWLVGDEPKILAWGHTARQAWSRYRESK